MVNDNWGTPLSLFRRIEREMNIKFTLDPCTTDKNRLGTLKYYTIKENGLIQSWEGEIVYVNPPYSRGQIKLWVKKCRIEAFDNNALVVGLLPLRSALWFRENILPFIKILQNIEDWIYLDHGDCGLFFLERRIKFYDYVLGAPIKDYPNFDNILVIWKGGINIDWKKYFNKCYGVD